MSSVSKTPYEIRTELLHLACSICQQRAYAESALQSLERWKSNTTQPATEFQTVAPTTEEIIAEATKLNDFVSAAPRPPLR